MWRTGSREPEVPEGKGVRRAAGFHEAPRERRGDPVERRGFGEEAVGKRGETNTVPPAFPRFSTIERVTRSP